MSLIIHIILIDFYLIKFLLFYIIFLPFRVFVISWKSFKIEPSPVYDGIINNFYDQQI